MTVSTELLKINVGCGDYPLPGYCNIDELGLKADMACHVPPLPFEDSSASEIWGCHFFEHLDRASARAFLHECRRVLVPGGTLALVVPDTHEIMRRYVNGEVTMVHWPEGVLRDMSDLDEICTMMLYSTEQESHHQWSWDLRTLRRFVEAEGFFEFRSEIDRYGDPRIPVGAWYQTGAEWVRV